MFGSKRKPDEWPWVKIGETGGVFYCQADIADPLDAPDRFQIRRMTTFESRRDMARCQAIHAEFAEKYRVGAALRNNDHQRSLLEAKLKAEEDQEMAKVQQIPTPEAVKNFARDERLLFVASHYVIAPCPPLEGKLLDAYWTMLEEQNARKQDSKDAGPTGGGILVKP